MIRYESPIPNMKERRIQIGVTQEDIALYCGISKQTYYNWEHGLTKAIKEENFARLKEVFDSNGAVIRQSKKEKEFEGEAV